MIPVCERLGVGVLPTSRSRAGSSPASTAAAEPAPEGTRLAGRDELATGADWDAIEALERFAEERGVELIDVAVGALAAQPTVASVIAGATTPEQVRRNAQAGRWQPTPEEDLIFLPVFF